MRRTVHPRRLALMAIAVCLLAGSAPAARAVTPAAGGPHVVKGARIRLVFADPGTGYSATTGDRLDSLVWTDSAGHKTANFVAEGGPIQCGDPVEFMGQSYGEPEGSHPGLVYAGTTSKWTQSSAGAAKSATTGTACSGPEDAKTITTYTAYTTSTRRNEFRIDRTFKFSKSTPVFNGHGVRPYVPRLPNSVYHTVLWPNAAGTALGTGDSGSCGGDCEVTDWNQRWFADDNGSGSGMVVIRATTSNAPALLTVNNDSFSGSNLSSVVLIQPVGGWKAPVTETEYLCFYDPASWSAAARAALKLPKGCKA